MTTKKDLEAMIEAISVTIVREESEEQFYRRSASGSTSQAAKDLFIEIAEQVEKHRMNLEHRRDKLFKDLEDLAIEKGK